jgi:hypothetical protein
VTESGRFQNWHNGAAGMAVSINNKESIRIAKYKK